MLTCSIDQGNLGTHLPCRSYDSHLQTCGLRHCCFDNQADLVVLESAVPEEALVASELAVSAALVLVTRQ